MATYVKYQIFVKDLGEGTHKLHAAGDTLKGMMSNTAPNVATHVVRGDVTECTTSNGYTSGGVDAQNGYTATTGTGTLTCVDIVWTASGGSMPTMRYAILYNDTPAAPLDPLISYWDYGSSVTPAVGETFTIDFGASTATIV